MKELRDEPPRWEARENGPQFRVSLFATYFIGHGRSGELREVLVK